MKYWRGYLTAGILALITVGLMLIAERFSQLVDMVYPYVTREVQTILAGWSSTVGFTLWQVLVVAMVLAVVVTLVLAITLKKSIVQWLGWVLAGASVIWLLHTGIYGLNYYAGPISDDVRLGNSEFTAEDLEKATIYFRDMANQMAKEMPRDENGKLIYDDFDTLAVQAGQGFNALAYEQSGSIFAGCTIPVKKLGWADMYTSMGITGVTMPLTGEAAVNPNIPAMSLPFTMCHEMAHRMCIAFERDANLAAFLACQANPDPIFQYSGYFMAFRYCYNALVSLNTTASASAAQRLLSGCNEYVTADLNSYKAFFAANMDAGASDFAHSVNNAYIQGSGDPSGTDSYNEVSDLLVSWHIQNIDLPDHMDELPQFDPQDKNQVGDD